MNTATRQRTNGPGPSHLAIAAVVSALVACALAVLPLAPASAAPAPATPTEAAAPDPALDPRGADLFRLNAEASSAAPTRAVAAHPDDVRWFDGLALPDVDGRVMDFAEFRGELVVAGFFRQIGGREVDFIARWNGSEWLPLGTGMGDAVRTLEVIDDRLYAGGYFVTAGGVAAEAIASWDGTSWSAVGTGLHGSVNAIAAHLGGIAVAGDLTIGSTGVNVAQWDGSQWSPLLTGLDDAVYDVTIFSGQLVAAGAFRNKSGTPLEHVAIFDGALWTAPDGGITGAQITPSLVNVSALAVHDGQLWVSGSFDQAGSRESRNVAAWNGTDWGDAGALYGFARGLRVVGGTLYAFGSLWADSLLPGLVVGVRQWADTAWVQPTVYPREPVQAMGGYRDSLVVSGTAVLPHEDVMIRRAAGWTSLRAPWRPQDRGIVGRSHGTTVRALQTLGPRLFAGGDFSAAGGASGLTNAPAFSHTLRGPYSWRVEPLATDFDGRVNAFCEFQGTIVAGGLFTGAPVSSSAERFTNIARWDGAGWLKMGTLGGEVFAFAVYRGQLYAGGTFHSADGGAVSGIARWSGASWIPVGDATGEPGVVYALLADADSLWIGGAFNRLGGEVVMNIARWNGTTYLPLGFGVRTVSQGGYATAMARYGGRLVVGGVFDRAGLLEAPQLAQWNGLDWEPFGTQTWGGNILTLRTVNGTLWAGGQFYEQGGTPMYLASWDSTSWVVPGSGPQGLVYALASVADTLYAGGAFTVAGGKASYHVARWGPPPVGPPPPANLAKVESSPNPMTGAATLLFTLPSSSGYVLAIHDITGRQVYSRSDPSAGAGPQQVSWDGRGDDGGLVPAGLYFVRVVSAGEERAKGRIAVVR